MAVILREQGVRLGLEYVGPKTSWASRRYPFIHTLAEMRDLQAEINTGNVGFLLDSWHWYHAGETVEDILSLKPEEILAVDLNDAPAGIPVQEQIDSGRELPAATGVIDHRHRIFGYEGLYVVDGSAISANPGVNPSLTIAALAERAMAQIPVKQE